MVNTIQDAGLKDLLTMLSNLQLSTERVLNDTEAVLCQGNDITTKPAEVYIQFLTDGLTNEYKGDTALFVSGPVKKVSKKAVFKELPISRNAKLVDFLNNLTNIYQNFRKNKMDEVYFMLNTFSNDVPKTQLEKECKSISDDLVRRGFSRKNIYACDLRKAIEGGIAMKELFGLPSYDIFKQQCINEMIESGISRKYTAIYNSWLEYFKKNLITVDEHIVGLEQALEDRENRIRELNRKIELVEKISVGSVEPILTKVKKDYYDYFYELIDSTFRGNKRTTGILFWAKRTRRTECEEAMTAVKDLLPEMAESSESIKKLVSKALNELELAYDSSEGIDQKLIDPSEVIFTLAAENIGNKLYAADDNTRFWNKSKNTEYYMDQIQSMISDDYKRSAEKARRYYRQLVSIFEQRRTNILKTMRHELNTTQSPELIKRFHFPELLEVRCKQCGDQEHHHAENKQVGMYLSERGRSGEAIELGEFPVEYTHCHSRYRIDQREVKILFHFCYFLSLS